MGRSYLKQPLPLPEIIEDWCDGCLIMHPVSEKYNGGILVDDKHYLGFQVPEPLIPEEYTTMGINCGLERNSRPPRATLFIKRKDGNNVSKIRLKKALRALWEEHAHALPSNTTHCPKHPKVELEWENYGGVLGLMHDKKMPKPYRNYQVKWAQCPKCHRHYEVRK